MPVEFVTRASDSGSGSGRKFRQRPARDPGLFWWTIVIIFLTGVVIFSWVFSIYVFSYPEKPFFYKLLTRLEKIDPVIKFERLKVPGGRERTAKQIYASFYDYDPTLTDVQNSGLMRSYLWNYSEEDPIYILGKFEVTHSRTLADGDIFPSGVVIRAKATDYPSAFLEFIFPTAPGEAPEEHFRPGDIINLEKNRSYEAVLHLDWLSEDDLLISAISLVYGRHRIDDTRFINQAAPTVLNMEGAWPIFDVSASADPAADDVVAPEPEITPEENLETE